MASIELNIAPLIPESLSDEYKADTAKNNVQNTQTAGGSNINVGNPEHYKEQHVDAKEVRTQINDYHNKQSRDNLQGEHTANQENIWSAYVNDPRRWFDNYKYWNWNLAKNNPRGDLNNRSYRSTLNMSRMADALNNRRHLKPTDIGHRTLHYGSTGTGAEQAGSERWEPIETQEIRQMRANETLDKTARGFDVQRQANIENYPLELQKMRDQAVSQMATYVGKNQEDIYRAAQKAILDTQYIQNENLAYKARFEQFLMELGLDKSDKIFKALSGIQGTMRQFMANIYASGAITPTIIQEYEDRFLQKLMNNMTGFSDREKMEMFAYAKMFNSMDLSGANISALRDSLDNVFRTWTDK